MSGEAQGARPDGGRVALIAPPSAIEPATASAARRRERALFTALALLGFAAVTYADYWVQSVSLGFLYLVPLGLFASARGLGESLLLALAGVVLRDIHSPEQEPATFVARNLLAAFGYVAVAVIANRLASQRTRLEKLAERQRDELFREARLAAQTQAAVLPHAPTALRDYEIQARMLPRSEVGGDLYDFFAMADGQLALSIGDVAGKGMSAALLMPLVVATLRAHARSLASPSGVLEALNRSLLEVTDAARYVSLFYGRLSGESGRLEWANGGHVPGLVLRADGGSEWLESTGPPVGLLEEARYETRVATLGRGDTLVLYTDGLSEAESPGGEPLGLERLAELAREAVRRPGAGRPDALFESVTAFQGGPLSDDATLLLVTRCVDVALE